MLLSEAVDFLPMPQCLRLKVQRLLPCLSQPAALQLTHDCHIICPLIGRQRALPDDYLLMPPTMPA